MSAKILIVEDNEVTGKFLHSLLSGKGYEVKILQEGSEVVDEARIFSPHLILMDILLPDMNGAEAVKMLQDDARTCNIPVIFLSAVHDQNDKEGNTITVNDIVYPAFGKSITTKNFLNAIQKALKKNP